MTPASGISPILPASTGNSALNAYTGASLGALSSGVDYTQSPTYQSLLGLIGPGANGALNPNLAAEYSSGSALIGQQTGQNTASALSGAQGRGLGGSSIAEQGVENAQFQGTMADSSLLASLYGQQNQNTASLAGDLVSGSNSEMTDLLGIYDNAGTSAANMSMYSQGLQEALSQAGLTATATEQAGMFGGIGSIIGGALGGI